MPVPDVEIRVATPAEEPFLRAMLYEAACPTDPRPPFAEVMANPAISRYIDGWGRPGDVGVVAETDGMLIGAAWYRLFSEEEPGYGFISPSVPELTIAVVPEWRGHDLGKRLISHLLQEARADSYGAISLSVGRDNAMAMSIYARSGFTVVRSDEHSITMQADLSAVEPL